MPKRIFQMMFLLIRTAWISRDVRQDYKSYTNEQMDWLIEWGFYALLAIFQPFNGGMDWNQLELEIIYYITSKSPLSQFIITVHERDNADENVTLTKIRGKYWISWLIIAFLCHRKNWRLENSENGTNSLYLSIVQMFSI